MCLSFLRHGTRVGELRHVAKTAWYDHLVSKYWISPFRRPPNPLISEPRPRRYRPLRHQQINGYFSMSAPSGCSRVFTKPAMSNALSMNEITCHGGLLGQPYVLVYLAPDRRHFRLARLGYDTEGLGVKISRSVTKRYHARELLNFSRSWSHLRHR